MPDVAPGLKWQAVALQRMVDEHMYWGLVTPKCEYFHFKSTGRLSWKWLNFKGLLCAAMPSWHATVLCIGDREADASVALPTITYRLDGVCGLCAAAGTWDDCYARLLKTDMFDKFIPGMLQPLLKPALRRTVSWLYTLHGKLPCVLVRHHVLTPFVGACDQGS